MFLKSGADIHNKSYLTWRTPCLCVRRLVLAIFYLQNARDNVGFKACVPIFHNPISSKGRSDVLGVSFLLVHVYHSRL